MFVFVFCGFCLDGILISIQICDLPPSLGIFSSVLCEGILHTCLLSSMVAILMPVEPASPSN